MSAKCAHAGTSAVLHDKYGESYCLRCLGDRYEAMMTALRVLVERVEYYAPSMAAAGDLNDARAALAKARGGK